MIGRQYDAMPPLPAAPQLESTKFNPAYTNFTVPYPKGQVWNGPLRRPADLVADCKTKQWADKLAYAYNRFRIVEEQLRESQQYMETLEDAVPAILENVVNALNGLADLRQANDPGGADAIRRIASYVREESQRTVFTPPQ